MIVIFNNKYILLKVIIIKTTSDNSSILEKISLVAVKKKIVACANLLPNCISFFYWDDKIQRSNEHILLLKTLIKNEHIVYKLIKKMHNYDTPEIITINISKVDDSYKNWLIEMVDNND